MKESIVIFSSSWGARYGGIDSFNYDLCVALAIFLKFHSSSLSIVCILNENSSTKDETKAADSLGIERFCIAYNKNLELDQENIISFLSNSKIKPVCVVGHDVHTGQRAIDLAKHYDTPSAVFHHMNYKAYKSDDEESIKKQENILRDSSIVFAVGCTLADSAKTILNGFKPEGCVKILEPGITQGRNIADKPPPNFSAIVLGRVNLGNDLVKQIKLAVASFGQATFEEPDRIQNRQPSLTVIGLSKDTLEADQTSLKKLAKSYAQTFVSICPWAYKNERKAVFDELTNKTVCMVLSAYEGFSLTGLEAISVGVPLILSENTGLYKTIDNYLGGAGTGCLYPVKISASESTEHDLKNVVSHLRKIASNPEKAKQNAMRLRRNLICHLTWEKTAQDFLREIGYDLSQKAQIGLAVHDSSETSAEICKLSTSVLYSLNSIDQVFRNESIFPNNCHAAKAKLKEIRHSVQLISVLLSNNMTLPENLIAMRQLISAQQFYFNKEISELDSLIHNFCQICQEREGRKKREKRERIQRQVRSLMTDELIVLFCSHNDLRFQEGYEEKDAEVRSLFSSGSKSYVNNFQSDERRQITQSEKDQLVELLLSCDAIKDTGSRAAIVGRLGDIFVQRHNVDRVDLCNIVNSCSNYHEGIERLVDSVRYFEGNSLPMQALDKYVEEFISGS